MKNRLSKETSPYLKQHQSNPVDWYPWGEEAISRAKAEDKPILLSIGYSACHWCHVMEKESFENPAIAAQMNENFICIKVDREERPDLDQIYQNVAQLITRSGGWPLTVFLTPELEPYFGGTYFPPEDRYGRPGFPKVLESLSGAYKNQRPDVLENANRLVSAIAELEKVTPTENKLPSQDGLKTVFQNIVSWVDWKNGGFGGAPKFPNPMNLSYLWRYFLATGVGMAEEATLFSLEKMAQSGMFDQMGGGFHRYSVDASFSVPHFEKMLYDNALLLKLYSEVLTTSPKLSPGLKKLFQKTITSSFDYLMREMKSPTGAFYSTQDADSEGEEGKFFVWNKSELSTILKNQTDLDFFCESFGVSVSGNFEESGKTVLFQTKIFSDEEELRLQKLITAVLDSRTKNRIPPGLDHKILTSWNGLLISGLCQASKAFKKLGDQERAISSLKAAENAFSFFETKMVNPKNSSSLYSVFSSETPTSGGTARIEAFLDDYSFLAMAALDLSRSVSDPKTSSNYLSLAKKWADYVIDSFLDTENGGFFFTSTHHEKLIGRPKTLFDQAIPSGNAVMFEVLLVLSELGLDPDLKLESIARENLARFFPLLEKQAFGMGELALSSLLLVSGVIAVTGDDALSVCQHPHVFQKVDPEFKKGFLLCHQKTCLPPIATLEKTKEEINRVLVFGPSLI